MPDPGEPPYDPDDLPHRDPPIDHDAVEEFPSRRLPDEQEIALMAVLNTLELEVLLREAAGE